MRRKHWLLAAVVSAVAGLGSISFAGAVAPAKPKTVHKVTLGRDVVWAVQRRLLGHVHASLGTERLEVDRNDHSLEPAGKVRGQRDRQRQNDQLRDPRCGRQLTGSVSGNTMSGTYKSVPAGGTWSAHKTS